jgi:hypothetical protein
MTDLLLKVENLVKVATGVLEAPGEGFTPLTGSVYIEEDPRSLGYLSGHQAACHQVKDFS